MAQPSGTAPRRVSPGVWKTRKGATLSPAQAEIWERYFRTGRTDGKGHFTKTPSVVFKQPAAPIPLNPNTSTAVQATTPKKPSFDTFVKAKRGDPAARSQVRLWGIHKQREAEGAASAQEAADVGLFGAAAPAVRSAHTIVNPVAASVIEALSPTNWFPATGQALHGEGFNPLMIGLEAASVFPFGRAVRLGKAAAEALPTAENAARAARIAETRATRTTAANARKLTYGDLTQQMPQERSPVKRAVIDSPADVFAEKHPEVRVFGAGSRVAREAGRSTARRQAMQAAHMLPYERVLPRKGSDEDIAHAIWAQLPVSHRNQQGLVAYAGLQEGTLRSVVSGEAQQEAVAAKQAILAEMRELRVAQQDPLKRAYLEYSRADDSPLTFEEFSAEHPDLVEASHAWMRTSDDEIRGQNRRFNELRGELDAAKWRITDVAPGGPLEQDLTVKLARLRKVIEADPTYDPRVAAAVHAFSGARRGILESHGLLDPEQAVQRQGLVSRMLGLDSSGARSVSLTKSRIAGRLVDDLGAAIGPDDWITLYHGTTPERAAEIRTRGFVPGGKVRRESTVITDQRVADALGKKIGDTLGYEPGVGQGEGVYLTTDPRYAELTFGEEVIPVRVRVSDLSIPPERLKYRNETPIKSLLLDDGYVEKPIPPEQVGEPIPGGEAYLGHRLPKDEKTLGVFPRRGGTGRVALPPGVTRPNQGVLVRQGRAVESTHIARDDWQYAQTYANAVADRVTLGKMGRPYKPGSMQKGDMLINPQGLTIPKGMRVSNLRALEDAGEDPAALREAADQILGEFMAEASQNGGGPAVDALLRQAEEQGINLSQLRIVPGRLVRRYYGQIRPGTGITTGGKIYDNVVNLMVANIVFGRVGYIPKQYVQNLAMAVPHQGAFLLMNMPRAGALVPHAGQSDLARKAWDLATEAVGSGATAALAAEAGLKGAPGKVAHKVTRVADAPFRVSALIHEASKEGVVPKFAATWTDDDLRAFVDWMSATPESDYGHSFKAATGRATEAMGDFSRMTPEQRKWARRFLIVPGWIVAGTRYPIHFAVSYPGRTAVLAYLAAGEPGSPYKLNKPIDEYITKGMPFWVQSVTVPGTGGKQQRLGSISPVSMTQEMAGALARGDLRGFLNYANPLGPTLWDVGQSQISGPQGSYPAPGGSNLARFLNAARSAGEKQLAPNVKLIEDLISPPSKPKYYPDDTSRLGRLARETGVVPIRISPVEKKGKKRKSRSRGRGTSYFQGGGSRKSKRGGTSYFIP